MNKKAYINPIMTIVQVNCHAALLGASQTIGGDVTVTYGGTATGKSADVKSDTYNVWDDDWSN